MLTFWVALKIAAVFGVLPIVAGLIIDRLP